MEKTLYNVAKLFDLDTVIFRYFNVYGERQPIERSVCSCCSGIFLRQRAAGEPLTIVGDGEQRRDFTYVGDVVNANIMAAIGNADEEAYGQVYNIGNGVNYSVNEVAAMISDNTTNIPPRIGESRVTCANNQKIYEYFWWRPKVKLENWVRNNYDSYFHISSKSS